MAGDDTVNAMSEPASTSSPVPRSAVVLGLMLFACAFLPLTPAGRSFVQVVRDTFADGVLHGVVMAVGFGSPFLFGLGVAVGTWVRDEELAARLVRNPVTMLHSQLVLVAWVIWRNDDDAVAALPLLGFAVVSGIYLMMRSGSERAAGRTPSFAWLVRWGAMMIAAVAGWLLLQRTGGLVMGRAVEVAGLCALGLALRVRPPRVVPAVPVDVEPGA
jgi:hypothetical protein